jgi:NADH-quinone oxidoreductase subunit C
MPEPTGAAPNAAAPSLSRVLATVLDGLGERVLAYHDQHGDDCIVVAAADRLAVAEFLKNHADLCFDMLMDSTAVDWERETPRFEVVDHFFSTKHLHRLRMKCRVAEDPAELPSLAPLYGSALWMERETYDMYGVVFLGHPDLRRVLLYPQFKGFPLRKDYDKLQAWPLFAERYAGTRELPRIVHPKPGDQEPPHEP